MLGIARVGDVGHGYCEAGHPDVPAGQPKEMTTTFVSGNTTVLVNMLPVCCVGDKGETDCQGTDGEFHHTTAVSGSGTVFIGMLAVHCVGDKGTIDEENEQYNGEYTVVSGSTDVLMG